MHKYDYSQRIYCLSSYIICSCISIYIKSSPALIEPTPNHEKYRFQFRFTHVQLRAYISDIYHFKNA